MRVAFITGRSPKLAQKEIEATATILPFQWSLSILQTGPVLLKPEGALAEEGLSKKSFWSGEYQNLLKDLNSLQDRLGGTLKIGLVFEVVAREDLAAKIGELLQAQSSERLVFGLSLYGSGINPVRLGLSVKTALKKQGQAARFVAPTKGDSLSTTQVFHNKLGRDAEHLEVLIVQEGEHYWLGLTVASQDIASYRKRDFSIPVPDPVSGMLSPKLAQMMINLAVSGEEKLVYDPFCGNGRIVLEARLMGLKAVGSDLRAQQVEASSQNLAWLAEEYGLVLEQPTSTLFWQQDATKLEQVPVEPFVIATEPYLGPPLRRPLGASEEGTWLKELQELYLGFFAALRGQKNHPEQVIIVFPKAVRAGHKPDLSLFNSLVDRLQELGYSSLQMSEYGRTDALVKREIVHLRVFK